MEERSFRAASAKRENQGLQPRLATSLSGQPANTDAGTESWVPAFLSKNQIVILS